MGSTQLGLETGDQGMYLGAIPTVTRDFIL